MDAPRNASSDQPISSPVSRPVASTGVAAHSKRGGDGFCGRRRIVKTKVTFATLCRYRTRRNAECFRRRGGAKCSNCGRYAILNGGEKSSFRRPQFCDSCVRLLDGAKGGTR